MTHKYKLCFFSSMVRYDAEVTSRVTCFLIRIIYFKSEAKTAESRNFQARFIQFLSDYICCQNPASEIYMAIGATLFTSICALLHGYKEL